MEIIKVFVVNKENKLVKQIEFAISSWYCKPSILSCFAWFCNVSDAFRKKYLIDESLSYYDKVLLVTCSKYGCRQFLPFFSSSFPVYGIDYSLYKKDLDWITLEFNDNAKDLKDYQDDFIQIDNFNSEIPF